MPSPSSLRAEAAFRERLAELGGTLLEVAWLGLHKPHRVRCAQGHENTPRPANVLYRGTGICRTCAGQDPRVAWAAFRIQVEELGGEVLEPAWLGSLTAHRVRCAQGHHCTPRPNAVQQGQGLCRTCAGQNSQAAWTAFRVRVAELGGEVLEPSWLGAIRPHRVRCTAGHDCTPRPNSVLTGQGLCRICAGRDSQASWTAFRVRVAELGGEVLEPAWLGIHTSHRVRCVQGHHCTPHPGAVLQGQGLCRICVGQIFDVVYVVTDDEREEVKFGITSGDPRPRLSDHRRDGLDTVIRLIENLPDGIALKIEDSIRLGLRDAKETPTRGREYFPGHCTGLILDIIDNHPAIRGYRTDMTTADHADLS